MDKIKIGVYGSAVDDARATQKADLLGKLLGEHKDEFIVITGAAEGIPYRVATAASAAGVSVWGYSAAASLEQQKQLSPDQDYSIYSKLVYIPDSYEHLSDAMICRKYRNVSSTAICDAGISISGRWGTLNEFTNLVDMGKIVGVLTGTGGVSDWIPKMVHDIQKNTGSVIVDSDDPAELLSLVRKELSKIA